MTPASRSRLRPRAPAVLVYDGECSICRAARDFALRRARPGRLKTVSFQHPDLERRAPGVRRERARREAVLLERDGRQRGGAAAVFGTLALLPLPWGPVGTLLSLPPLPALFEPLYRFVVRHRPALARLLRIGD